MTVVGDASAIIAVFFDSGTDGSWAAAARAGRPQVAPDLLPFECSNIVRREELAVLIGHDLAAQAHADLLDLPIELWPSAVLAARSWELRANLSMSDASSVALAVQLDAPLVTLDRPIARAPGVRCTVLTPPDR